MIPQEIEIDNYMDTLFPGGIFNKWFTETWQHTNAALDQNRVPAEWGLLTRIGIKGVRPVDDDKKGVLLKQAVADHANNPDFYAYSQAITYRDDPFGPSGITIDDFSVTRHREQIERSGAAAFHWGSWLDGTSADTVIRRFATYSKPQ